MDPIAWFARNKVAANLLMALIMAGGIFTLLDPASLSGLLDEGWEGVQPGITQEIFPEIDLDILTITVVYLGAAPEEVEQGVCIRVEEAIQGLDGIKEVNSVASENVGVITVELDLGADMRKVADDVKTRVDAIDTFPAETEKPVIQELSNRRQVIDVAVSGQADEKTLRHLAEQVRDEISVIPGITLVDLANARPYEISIEISESALRRHQLTFDFVANAVRRSSLDLPGGSVRTAGGEILLRSMGQAYVQREFEDLVLLTRPDGTHLRLSAVAHVRDGFEVTDQFNRFDREPAQIIEVFRTGDQSALAISDAVQEYVEAAQARMPEGVKLTAWQDGAQILRGRLDLMMRNGRAGFVLVFITLALFLRLRLAFWVSVGLLLSFLGAIWLMPILGLSINLITLFAFILVLGIVVDDAIVVGENIFTHQRTEEGLAGAIAGTKEVARPVIFAVLTTVAAFTPLIAVPGTTGKIMKVIPLVVIPCLLWSLVESMFILPAHLSHGRRQKRETGGWHLGRRLQRAVGAGLDGFIRRVYTPVLDLALEWRYVALAVGVATLMATTGMIGGGFVRFIFFPHVESDFMSASLTMRPGTPVDTTSAAIGRIEAAADQVRQDLIDETGTDYFRYMVSTIGEQPFSRLQRQNAGGYHARESSSNLGEVIIELLPGEDREISSEVIVERWRKLAGLIPDSIELSYTASLFNMGSDIDVRLIGPDIDTLQAAAAEIKERLAGFTGVAEITDSFRPGKEEIRLGIKPAAEVLGLTLSDLARQVRQAFYGEEVQRIQRGRNDVRVMVRYPEEDRRSLGDLERMRIRTPEGAAVPFSEVAEIDRGRGYAAITRVDRRRAINVTANVDDAQATPSAVITGLETGVMPDILQRFPGIAYTFEGQQAEQRETVAGLTNGFILALLMIFALLAVPLRSYAQPVIIMLAIPFGLVGAVWGHFLIGLDLNILSMFGLVALTGVVVNDSLVMVDFINRRRARSGDLLAGVRQAGVARFRPILLTSLTTFAGLSPLMLERSMQARFLIPMAVSLAFGVLFSTFITLVLIPAGYMVMEDLKSLPRRLGARRVATESALADGPGGAGGAGAARPVSGHARRHDT